MPTHIPPATSGSKVPDYVAELETHRHRGLDFILITQHPRLIDINLRELIEHHTHLGKTNLGLRRKMEWTTGGAKDPGSRANIKEALISVYRLDKSVYGLYKSAEVHTKIRTKKQTFNAVPARPMPRRLWHMVVYRLLGQVLGRRRKGEEGKYDPKRPSTNAAVSRIGK